MVLGAWRIRSAVCARAVGGVSRERGGRFFKCAALSSPPPLFFETPVRLLLKEKAVSMVKSERGWSSE
jgi:hypothetical protein